MRKINIYYKISSIFLVVYLFLWGDISQAKNIVIGHTSPVWSTKNNLPKDSKRFLNQLDQHFLSTIKDYKNVKMVKNSQIQSAWQGKSSLEEAFVQYQLDYVTYLSISKEQSTYEIKIQAVDWEKSTIHKVSKSIRAIIFDVFNSDQKQKFIAELSQSFFKHLEPAKNKPKPSAKKEQMIAQKKPKVQPTKPVQKPGVVAQPQYREPHSQNNETLAEELNATGVSDKNFSKDTFTDSLTLELGLYQWEYKGVIDTKSKLGSFNHVGLDYQSTMFESYLLALGVAFNSGTIDEASTDTYKGYDSHLDFLYQWQLNMGMISDASAGLYIRANGLVVDNFVYGGYDFVGLGLALQMTCEGSYIVWESELKYAPFLSGRIGFNEKLSDIKSGSDLQAKLAVYFHREFSVLRVGLGFDWNQQDLEDVNSVKSKLSQQKFLLLARYML